MCMDYFNTMTLDAIAGVHTGRIKAEIGNLPEENQAIVLYSLAALVEEAGDGNTPPSRIARYIAEIRAEADLHRRHAEQVSIPIPEMSSESPYAEDIGYRIAAR